MPDGGWTYSTFSPRKNERANGTGNGGQEDDEGAHGRAEEARRLRLYQSDPVLAPFSPTSRVYNENSPASVQPEHIPFTALLTIVDNDLRN